MIGFLGTSALNAHQSETGGSDATAMTALTMHMGFSIGARTCSAVWAPRTANRRLRARTGASSSLAHPWYACPCLCCWRCRAGSRASKLTIAASRCPGASRSWLRILLRPLPLLLGRPAVHVNCDASDPVSTAAQLIVRS